MANAIEIRKALLANQTKLNTELAPFVFKTIGTAISPRIESTVGGFCVAVPYFDRNGQPVKIFRIMIRKMNCHPSIGDRFREVSQYLQKKRLPYFVSFQYYNQALEVNGDILDGVIMDYVNGEDLVCWIHRLCNHPTLYESTRKRRFTNIAKNFRQMCIDLREAKISHGDMSGANIRVTTNDGLVLIDYDSICIPSLVGANYTTAGDGAFTHPERKRQKMTLTIDYFSEIVIYLSILALSKKPKLWDEYHTKDTQPEDLDAALFITQNDINSYESFIHSRIYKDLYSLSEQSEEIYEMLGRLCEAFSKNPYAIQFPFEGKWYGTLPLPKSIISSISTNTNKLVPKIIVLNPKSNDILNSIVDMKARFCGLCGHEFGINNFTDDYCPQCGTEREKLSYI